MSAHPQDPQSFALYLHKARNPEKPHPQSVQNPCRGKTPPGALVPRPKCNGLSDYSGARQLTRVYAQSQPAPTRQNPSATHGHTRAETARVSRHKGQQGNQTADTREPES